MVPGRFSPAGTCFMTGAPTCFCWRKRTSPAVKAATPTMLTMRVLIDASQ
jgi:hypothetical protein